MDFRGSRQALSYHDGIAELPSDVLARVMAAVVIHGGSAAAGRLRRTCRFFGRLGGYAAMEQGCRAALAVLKGCSEADVQLHRQPADEEWMRTAAITFAGPMGREEEELYLLVVRFLVVRRAIQRLPCGDAVYDTMVNSLEAFLTSMRTRHGAEAVALALLAADIRESRELLPEGFRITAPEGGLRVTEGYPSTQMTCTLHIPGMTGTLHDGAVYDISLGVNQNYPTPPEEHPHQHGLLNVWYRRVEADGAVITLYHPNAYPSGKLCFHGMIHASSCWDASCSLTEAALHIFACLHQMNLIDPAHASAYKSATKDRPAFRRHVREGAIRAKCEPPPPTTPVELQHAVLLPDPTAAPLRVLPPGHLSSNPNRHRFRSFELEGRTLRLHWPAEGKWPTFTWPDDMRDGAMVDREPVHFGWL